MTAWFTIRRLDSTKSATYGEMVDDEERSVGVTLEPPWVDKNEDGISDKNVSRIPAGTYPAHRKLSPKRGYEVFELENVPGRTNIEIHIGNTTADTEGCILLGSNVGMVNGQHGITGSAAAFRKFMSLLTGVDRILLDVIDYDPVIVP